MFRLLLLGRRDFVLGLGGHLVHLGVHVVSIRQRHIYKGCPVRLYFAAGTDIFSAVFIASSLSSRKLRFSKMSALNSIVVIRILLIL